MHGGSVGAWCARPLELIVFGEEEKFSGHVFLQHERPNLKC